MIYGGSRQQGLFRSWVFDVFACFSCAFVIFLHVLYP